jgi:hypothetical protein
MKIYCFDIDGTLTNETEGHDYAKRTPNIGRIKRVRDLFFAGNTIILQSARLWEDEMITRNWLTDNVVPYHQLVLGKPWANVYVDDAAVNAEAFFKRSYNFHRCCYRYQEGRTVPDTEIHPCFFCGEKIPLKTKECLTCGIMPCPSCGKCLCSLHDIEYEALTYLHNRYCKHLANFIGVVYIPSKLHIPETVDIMNHFLNAVSHCYEMEFKCKPGSF